MYEERRVDLGGEVELTDKVVFINRVSKVVKGGRRFGFTALVVSGDGAGHVGFALGKAGEVPAAIQKGSEKAHKRLVRIPLVGTTIPHNVIGRFGPTQVVLLPARPGTGVIAGSAVRAVVEAAGIKDIRTKVIGSNNPNNVLNATMEGLLRLKSPEDVSQVRGISLEEMGYAPF
ncbi:MAG: 30S ribosomal protein S5 [Candidatus Dadabacteria bacterium]|nr:MAG: 30S ribosomal protein S5 [Candidatus Dadabacteria bacterium]